MSTARSWLRRVVGGSGWGAARLRRTARSQRGHIERLEPRLTLSSYYVALTGNDSNAGTLEAPFGTIGRGMEAAQPGDSVLLRGGVYRETISAARSGLAGQPITIASYNGEQVTISAGQAVDGPWTETSPGSGIYWSPTTASLPASFWTSFTAQAGGTQIVERSGSLVVTVVNDAAYRTASTRSASAASAWNFFAEPITWRTRGLSIDSTGATAMPLGNATAFFSIMTSSGSGYSADDSVNVSLNGNGVVALRLKKDTVNSWGSVIGSATDPTISGFDLTLGPGDAGYVAYALTAYPTGQTVASGQWAMTQADWSDGGDGSKSYVQIFAQENVSPALDPTQQFELAVGSYEIIAGSGTVLRDEFADGDPTTADYFPSARNVGVSSGYDQIFVDGQMQTEARFANKTSADLLSPDTVSLTMNNTYGFTGSAFSGKPDNFFAGARFLGRVGQGWSWQTAVVTSSAGNAVQLDSTTASTWWWPNFANQTSNSGIGYLYGKLEFLDADGEWHLQKSADGPDTLYVRMAGGADPTGHVVEQKARNWTVNVNGYNNIVVRGLNLRGGAVRLNGSGIVLEDCDARYLSHFLTFSQGGSWNGGLTQGGGVLVSGSNNVVRGCSIYDTAGSGILAIGTDHLLTRNYIHHTDYSGTYATGMVLSGSGHSATFNTIHDSGRDILQPIGSGLTVMYNDLSRAGRMALDLGLVYTYGTNGQDASGRKTRIAYNWVHENGNPADPFSKGIYLDNYTRNFIVDHNVIWDIGKTLSSQSGIKLNSPTLGNEVYHNTLVGAPAYNLTTWTAFPDSNPDATFWTTDNHGMDYIAQNNLLIAKGADVSTILEDYAARAFRPKPGTAAVDPAAATNTVAWVTTNGSTNVPAGFTLSMRYKNQRFAYNEVAGQGLVLPGINDSYVGATPDSGAYERGGAYWTAGVDATAPTVVNPAAADPDPVAGAAAALSVLGEDETGESNLTYTWLATTLPVGAAAPSFSANGTNAAKNSTATFTKAGDYVLTVTIVDGNGLSTTSSVSVTVNQTLTSIEVSPAAVSLYDSQTQLFSAVGKDQFGDALTAQPGFIWSATAGVITAGGLYTAPATDATATVTATSAGVSGMGTVYVTGLPQILSWQSARNHGSLIDVTLPITDDAKFSEPRTGGVQRLIVTFDRSIAPESFTAGSVLIVGNDRANSPLDLSSIVITAALTGGNTQGIIDFGASLPDRARYLIRLQGISDPTGNALYGDHDRVFTNLKGDSSGDLRTNVTDLSYIQSGSTTSISRLNIKHVRSDLNLDGRVNASDLSASWAVRNVDARNIATPSLPAEDALAASMTYTPILTVAAVNGAPTVSTSLGNPSGKVEEVSTETAVKLSLTLSARAVDAAIGGLLAR